MLKSWKTTVAGLMTATGDPTTNGWVGIGVTTWVWNSTDSVTKQTGDNTVLSKDYSATGIPFAAGAKYVIRPATYYGGTNGVVQFGIGGNYGRYFYIYCGEGMGANISAWCVVTAGADGKLSVGTDRGVLPATNTHSDAIDLSLFQE